MNTANELHDCICSRCGGAMPVVMFPIIDPRTYLAGQALPGLLAECRTASGGWGTDHQMQILTEVAVRIADLALEALDRKSIPI